MFCERIFRKLMGVEWDSACGYRTFTSEWH